MWCRCTEAGILFFFFFWNLKIFKGRISIKEFSYKDSRILETQYPFIISLEIASSESLYMWVSLYKGCQMYSWCCLLVTPSISVIETLKQNKTKTRGIKQTNVSTKVNIWERSEIMHNCVILYCAHVCWEKQLISSNPVAMDTRKFMKFK